MPNSVAHRPAGQLDRLFGPTRPLPRPFRIEASGHVARVQATWSMMATLFGCEPNAPCATTSSPRPSCLVGPGSRRCCSRRSRCRARSPASSETRQSLPRAFRDRPARRRGGSGRSARLSSSLQAFRYCSMASSTRLKRVQRHAEVVAMLRRSWAEWPAPSHTARRPRRGRSSLSRAMPRL